MKQFPIEFVNSLRNRGAPDADTMLYIFICNLSDEEIAELEFTEFILGTDLDKFLDPNQSYQIDTLTDRDQ